MSHAARNSQATPTTEGTLAKLVRQLSKLGGTEASQRFRDEASQRFAGATAAGCKITRAAAAAPPTLTMERSAAHSTGVGCDEVLEENDSFLEPLMSREESLTWAGDMSSSPPMRSGGGHHRSSPSLAAAGLGRMSSFRLGAEHSGFLGASNSYLARTLVDEGSQCELDGSPPHHGHAGQVPQPEQELSRLLAAVQQAQIAELTLLSARLQQKEQEVAEAAAQRAEAQEQTSRREAWLAASLEEAGHTIAQLQQKVEQLQAAAVTAQTAGNADLEVQLEEARHSVAALEAQVAALELERRQTGARLSELQQLSGRVARMVQAVMCLPGEGGEDDGGITEDGVAAVEHLIAQHAALQERYLAEAKMRKELHNELMDLKGAIRVFCRVRPLCSKEKEAGVGTACKCDSLSSSIEVTCGRVGGMTRTGAPCTDLKVLKFDFDRVFGPNSTQDEVFRETSAIVTSVLDGYNAAVFAYGQTGSGKTYTMEGTPEHRGVNYRTVQQLFALISQRGNEVEYTATLSLMEVYMEQIRCLLSPSSERLDIKLGPDGSQQIPGLTEVEVTEVDQVWSLLRKASAARHAGETQMNKASSRSHCLLCLRVDGRSRLTSDAFRSQLWLVDLAGSERVAKTEATGERLKEAQFINKSLSALGDCIYALASKSGHIPFRNSKLTFLLQSSLSGAGKTLMFVNVNPSDLDAPETVCSLTFASRVRGVELGAVRRNVVSEQGSSSTALKELMATVGALQEQVGALEAEKGELQQQLCTRSMQIQKLQAQLTLGDQHPPCHHRTDTAGSMLAGGLSGVAGGEKAAEASFGPPRSWSAPDRGLGGSEAAWGGQLHLPLPAALLAAEEGPGGRGDNHDEGNTTGRGRAVSKIPVPRLPLGSPATPKDPISARAATPKISSKAGTLDQLSHRGDTKRAEHSSSTPNSARALEVPRSAPSSAGRAVRPSAAPGSDKDGIKSWRPDSSVSKPVQAAKGRWT